MPDLLPLRFWDRCRLRIRRDLVRRDLLPLRDFLLLRDLLALRDFLPLRDLLALRLLDRCRLRMRRDFDRDLERGTLHTLRVLLYATAAACA